MTQVAKRGTSMRTRMDAELLTAMLAFLGADHERLDRFLAATGMTVDGLRAASGTAGFAESLLDFISSDEGMFLLFAEENRLDPAGLARLRGSLNAVPPHDP